MHIDYSAAHKALQHRLRAWVNGQVLPLADAWDSQEAIPQEVIRTLVKETYADQALDAFSLGILFEELGRGSVSLASLLVVHAMCLQGIGQWGTPEQQEHWLPSLRDGSRLGAFALTEPNRGSDARNAESRLVPDGDDYLLSGSKQWISHAQGADLFIVLAKLGDQPICCLLERDTPGLRIEPICGMLGFRSAMIGKLSFDRVRITQDALLGGQGMGFSHVAASCLDLGRYAVAWTCVGLAQACLEASLHYAQHRKQFDEPLRKHQLILEMLANMITQIKAARALCWRAAYLRDEQDPLSISETTTAKYFASGMVSKVASDALQIHGANGCGPDYPIQRFFRDARISQIIEGSDQMQQIMIAKNGFVEYRQAIKNYPFA
ncbi:acyl-CoA dehydrogenase family protein [Magnetovirga frankeli]|uniref:acyl-CoA dehydrogenase family protein n=1 Tax=Magnetovirga frankeli TaxID=947516 RepID=UPI0012938856|nr:acyl-CoA dehydrogenase family protein [gamma proteobacterium SS-5]